MIDLVFHRFASGTHSAMFVSQTTLDGMAVVLTGVVDTTN